MKVRLDFDGKIFEFEKDPMPPERFSALCKLAEIAIGGGVLLGAIHMVGTWAIGGAVGALVLVGLYNAMKHI